MGVVDTVVSVNGVRIRLTAERWFHIVKNHDEVAPYYEEVLQAVEEPDAVYRGYREALIAVRKMKRRRRWMVVVYKEVSRDDGFIITAYMTSKVRLKKEDMIWWRRR